MADNPTTAAASAAASAMLEQLRDNPRAFAPAAAAGVAHYALCKIDRLRRHIDILRNALETAIELDSDDDQGVPAVWLEAANEALKETNDGHS